MHIHINNLMTYPQDYYENRRHDECTYFVNGRCTLRDIIVNANGNACVSFIPRGNKSLPLERIRNISEPRGLVLATSYGWSYYRNPRGPRYSGMRYNSLHYYPALYSRRNVRRYGRGAGRGRWKRGRRY